MESELDGHGLFSIYYGELVTFHFYLSFKKNFNSFGGGNFYSRGDFLGGWR